MNECTLESEAKYHYWSQCIVRFLNLFLLGKPHKIRTIPILNLETSAINNFLLCYCADFETEKYTHDTRAEIETVDLVGIRVDC